MVCTVVQAGEVNSMSILMSSSIIFVAKDEDPTEEAIEMDSGGESEEDYADTAKGRGGGREGEQSATAAGAPIEDKVYIPGQPLDEGEELVHDSSAYHMYHAVSKCMNVVTK